MAEAQERDGAPRGGPGDGATVRADTEGSSPAPVTGELLPAGAAGGPVATGDSGLLAMGRTPEEAIENATHVARLLVAVVQDQGMYTMIPSKQGARPHINVEGWTTLGAMTGHTAVIEWTRVCQDDRGESGYEARAVLLNGAGAQVGAAEAMCTRSERDWKNRDSFALRAMAQTRAISRAFRSKLDFIVKIAGYATTPDSEMDVVATEGELVQRPTREVVEERKAALEAILAQHDIPASHLGGIIGTMQGAPANANALAINDTWDRVRKHVEQEAAARRAAANEAAQAAQRQEGS